MTQHVLAPELEHQNGYTIQALKQQMQPSTMHDNSYAFTLLDRITFNKNVLHGKPLIRGLRISVDMLLELLAKGATRQEILEDYPELEADDLHAALMYAYYLIAGETVLERVVA